MTVRPTDRQLFLQNMHKIDRLMNPMGSSNSHNTRTETSSLTNSTNVPANVTHDIGSVCPVHMSTNNHVTTSPLPPHDI